MSITEFAGILPRWLALASGTLCLGTLVLQRLAGDQAQPQAWRDRWRRTLLAACALWLCAGLPALSSTVVRATEDANLAWNLSAWGRLLTTTRYGTVWLVQQSAVALLLLAASLRRPVPWQLPAACAALALGAGAYAGHAAALEPAWPALLGNALHVIAVGVWLGALPALISLLLRAGAHADAETLLRRFSSLAMFCVCVIAASGVPLADLQIERIPALLGTRYGNTLLIKLALIAIMLMLAAHVRWRGLPRLALRPGADARRAIAARVLAEYGIGVLVLALAALLAQTVPARHDAIAWPFTFRFSIDSTWPDITVQEKVNAGLTLILIGALLAWTSVVRRVPRHALWGAAALAAAGLYLALPPLTVDAYPDTYRRTTVPYHAISIANGARLFAQHCVSCHGAAARGDGERAHGLPVRPADLTEPHTASHTAGDLYWWLSHGKSAGVMPAFESVLSDEERWDLINYLRVVSAGYQARILGERISPGRAWLAAPDFSFTTAEGRAGTLKDYRGTSAVLLVIARLPAAQRRLESLAAMAPELRDLGTEVLVLPTAASAPEQPGGMALTVIADGASEALLAWRELRRSFTDADPRNERPLPEHMELLIDRQGYIRARWLPGEALPGWYSKEALLRELRQLQQEPPGAPADDHVH